MRVVVGIHGSVVGADETPKRGVGGEGTEAGSGGVKKAFERVPRSVVGLIVLLEHEKHVI